MGQQRGHRQKTGNGNKYKLGKVRIKIKAEVKRIDRIETLVFIYIETDNTKM